MKNPAVITPIELKIFWNLSRQSQVIWRAVRARSFLAARSASGLLLISTARNARVSELEFGDEDADVEVMKGSCSLALCLFHHS